MRDLTAESLIEQARERERKRKNAELSALYLQFQNEDFLTIFYKLGEKQETKEDASLSL